MQHLDETLATIRLENEMKYLEHTLETYVYSLATLQHFDLLL
jgi:hypothetical protein